jgi:hypothetical protein
MGDLLEMALLSFGGYPKSQAPGHKKNHLLDREASTEALYLIINDL